MNINRRNILIAAGIAGLAGYCIVLSLLVGLFTQPEAGTDPRFGALEISVANGDTDPMDEKGNSLFANLDKKLLRREQPELGELKLITLYKASLVEGGVFGSAGQEIVLDISEDHAADESLTILGVDGDRRMIPIPYTAGTRIRKTEELNKEIPVIRFTLSGEGYFGMAAERKPARGAGILAGLAIGLFTALYLLLFVVMKPQKLSRN